jgi:hypothetical protein
VLISEQENERGTYPGGKPAMNGGGKGGGPPDGKPGGGAPKKPGGGGPPLIGGGGTGGVAYACGAAPYTAPVLASFVDVVADDSAPCELPIKALCASN